MLDHEIHLDSIRFSNQSSESEIGIITNTKSAEQHLQTNPYENFSNTPVVTEDSSDDNIVDPHVPLLSLFSNESAPLAKPKRGYSLSDLCLNDTPVQYISGMFPRGKLSALVGESGKGKGWVLPAAALTIAASKEFLLTDNYELRSDGRVLLVDTEGRLKTYSQRIIELGGKLENFIVPEKSSRILGFNSVTQKLIEDVIEVDQPELVIFDSFAGFSEVDENCYAVKPCLKWFVEIAERYNAAVVFTQLSNKSETKDGRLTIKSVRGFSGIHQFPEIIWAIDTPDKSDDRKKRLYQVKNNIDQKDNNDYVFILNESKITFTGEQIENQKTKINKRLEILRLNPDKTGIEIVKLIRENEPESILNTINTWVIRRRK